MLRKYPEAFTTDFADEIVDLNSIKNSKQKQQKTKPKTEG